MSNKRKNIRDQKNYESDSGFSSLMWGPAIWHFLHTISFNYKVDPSEADKQHYFNFITDLGYVLPCDICRNNYKQHLVDAKFSMKDLKNRHTFSCFVYRLHKKVNQGNFPVGYFKLRECYEKLRARCAPGSGKNCIPTADYVIPRMSVIIEPMASSVDKPSFLIDKDKFNIIRKNQNASAGKKQKKK